jgi:hypothetical protein
MCVQLLLFDLSTAIYRHGKFSVHGYKIGFRPVCNHLKLASKFVLPEMKLVCVLKKEKRDQFSKKFCR